MLVFEFKDKRERKILFSEIQYVLELFLSFSGKDKQKMCVPTL